MAGKKILHFGLAGPPKDAPGAVGDQAAIQQAVKDGAEKAREAGHTVQLTFFEPHEFPEALSRVRKELVSGKWDALVLGGGIRLAVPLTPQFEQTINMAIEVARNAAPDLKVLFQSAPGDIHEVVQRGFGSG